MTVSLRDGLLEANGEVRSEMRNIWKKYERMWIELVSRGQASGEFVRSGDPKMIAFGILGMCNWLARWYNPRKPVTVEELIGSAEQDLGLLEIAKREKGTLKSELTDLRRSARDWLKSMEAWANRLHQFEARDARARDNGQNDETGRPKKRWGPSNEPRR